ncbi:MAG TPA: hypothetical protein PLN19_01470 [Methanothrix sp.]|jgi:hypothetical protein|uniref:hypothetical protein n=1 Tax=Methanothrix sp. TaxID=90426 RepID=UPI002D0E9B1B|nr:hypothetical protein [Methanothrix sp.]HQE86920.1 hypothetical protein [Methanothrix sp.]HQI67837.1 hypothetical protein [Methanothrix sp.]HRS85709.1 hypothetical protein [Methanothrix sp.]HRU76421.1 hypothetical protein [Methanothrix sp.]
MSTEAEILKILFPPEGAVPLDRLNEINLIRGHIDVAIKLSQGFHPQRTGLAARYYDPEESQRITEKVVELRESLGPDRKRRSWPAIAAEAGNITPKAARMRYWKYKQDQKAEGLRKEAYAALSGELAHSDPTIRDTQMVEERPTIRDSRIVEKSVKETQDTIQNETSTSTKAQTTRRAPPRIPHSEDDFIDAQRDAGVKFKEIHEALRSRGHDCTIGDVMARHQEIRKKRSSESHDEMAHNAPMPKEMGRQDQINSDADAVSSNEEMPDPVPISRAELDQKMWDMWRTGMNPKQISEALNLEGYYYGEQSVRVRLRSQGADL